MATGLALDTRKHEAFGGPVRRAGRSPEDRESDSRWLRIVDVTVLGVVGVCLLIAAAVGGQRPGPLGDTGRHEIGPVVPAVQTHSITIDEFLQKSNPTARPAGVGLAEARRWGH